MKKTLVFALILLVIIPVVWLLVSKFEGKKPLVDIDLPSLYLKKSYEMTVKIEDRKTGLRKIMVSIMQKGKEKILLEKEYDSFGFFGVYSGAKHPSDSFTIPVQSWKYGMTDGDAVIRVMVSDYSWRGWNKGNVFYVEKNVIIDSTPPKLKVLSRRHYVEKGGSGLVIYKLFEKNIKSGVQVGDNFFPGHSGMFENEMVHAAFFALDHTQGPGTRLKLVASDAAGNETKKGFHSYIRNKKFKTDTLSISNGFLENKITGFNIGSKESSFQESQDALLEKYLYVNREVRRANVEKLLGVSKVTENKMYWDGRFLRMRGAYKAGYADKRIYKYKGKKIDQATHLGYDLASIANASIKAANAGRVIFNEYVGIFGNTVMIDHGFGLCSLYSHLSESTVEVGKEVAKGDEIGFTGETGLAGGDHLHFSMIVHNVFVTPKEWWDKNWIKNNITSKIDRVKQMPNL